MCLSRVAGLRTVEYYHLGDIHLKKEFWDIIGAK